MLVFCFAYCETNLFLFQARNQLTATTVATVDMCVIEYISIQALVISNNLFFFVFHNKDHKSDGFVKMTD